MTKETFLSVITLNKKINWSDNEVQLVICLCFGSNKNEELDFMYKNWCPLSIIGKMLIRLFHQKIIEKFLIFLKNHRVLKGSVNNFVYQSKS